MIPPIPRLLIPCVALALAAFASPAFAITLLDDSFTDLGRTNGADPNDSAWYLLANTTPATNSAASGSLSVGGTTAVQGTNPMLGTTFSSYNLAVGETITLSFDFRSTGPASATGLRFGLYNSGGTNPSGDIFANPPSTGTTFQNDLGYSVFAPHQGTQNITLYARPANATNNTIPVSAAANTTVLGSAALASATNTTNFYNASLALTRTLSGYNYAVGYAGTSFSGSTTNVQTSTFDSLVIFSIQTNSLAQVLTIDNVLVTAVPEPSVYGALGLLLCAAHVVRRRMRRRTA